MEHDGDLSVGSSGSIELHLFSEFHAQGRNFHEVDRRVANS